MKRTVVLLVVLFGLLGLAPREAGAAPEIVTGTGSFTTAVARIATDLSDCGDADTTTVIQLVSRTGTVDFSDVISASDGEFSSTSLREACSSPAQGTVRANIHLQNATVAGLTGELTIELEGVFEADPTSPSNSRTRLHGTITGVSGGLRNARGQIQSVGQATASTSANTYFVEIRLK